jgi:FtsP/CotA-like multicopper oxidase with cupredoxin domain
VSGRNVRPTTRRRFLASSALVGAGGAAWGAATLVDRSLPAHRQPVDRSVDTAVANTVGPAEHAGHDAAGGLGGPTFRTGRPIDHAANGFNPTDLLRDFDTGTTSVLPDGRTLREWKIYATDHEIEVAPGVRFPAWTFNSRVPGPMLRANAGDVLRVQFTNGSAHPHTMHFHGIHPAEMDGVPGIGAGIIAPGARTTYTFDAEPFGLHLYHCHVGPLAEHIARGMYGTFLIDPPQPRAAADELVMVMHGYNTNFDGQGNQLYAVNGIPFHYMDEPVRVRRGELVRIYLVNILEYDPINSFHLHGNFFDYYPTGTRLQPADYTDTVVLGQGQRGICEVRFPRAGRFMFHAHKTEFADLGWMGFFEVVE